MTTCGICGTENQDEMRFCGSCGGMLLPSRSVLGTAERRHVTVVFCDLVESTPLSQQVDPEELGIVLLRFRNIAAEAARHHGGNLIRFLGDGVLLCFGYPIALEDDTVNAVRCGHEIVDALKILDIPELGAIDWVPAARVGIHTGLTLVGDLGSGDVNESQTLVGEVPNLAARIQQYAPPNGVVISAATHRLVEKRIECQALGSVHLKGVRDPISLFVTTSVRPALDDPLRVRNAIASAPVGRDAEYNLIVARWELACAGNGQVGVLIAEAGMGKTHLARAVAARALEGSARVLVAACLKETSGSVLHPIAAMLRHELGLNGATVDEARGTIRDHMERLGGDETASLAVATLLGFAEPQGANLLSGAVDRAQAFALIAEWIVSAEDGRPTLFVLEDFHLADPSTLEFLGGLADQVAGGPCLLLATARPGVSAPWDHRSHGFTLHLGRLPLSSVSKLINDISDHAALPQRAVLRIAQRSDGVPLYVEEITKTVIEQLENGYGVPSTLQEILLSRLDRLGEAKPIAQLASCLGTEFAGELLFALYAGHAAEFGHLMEVLVSAEILIRHGVGNNARFSFRHGLFQEIAYHSLLRSRRRRYHSQIAEVIDSRFPNLAANNPEILAQHCAAGGLPEKAIQHWRAAAHLAYASSGFEEAVEFLRSALGQVPLIDVASRRDSLELALQVDIGTALIATHGEASPEVEHAYSRAESLLQQTDGKELNFPALRGLQTFYQVRGPLKTSRQLAERLSLMADTSSDKVAQVEAMRRLGWCLFCQGELAQSRKRLRDAIALYDPANAQLHIIQHSVDPAVLGRINLAWLEAFAGEQEHARREVAEAIGYGEALGHGLSLAYALGISAAVYQTLGDHDLAESQATKTLALARQRHLPYWTAFGALMRGWARAVRGDSDGLAELDSGLTAYRASGARLFVAYGLALKAQALLRFSRASDAEETLATAKREAADVQCRFVLPNILYLSAHCQHCLSGGDAAMTAGAFAAALAEAVSIGAGQIAQQILADGGKAGVWTSNEVASLTGQLSEMAARFRVKAS
jgi:class 3 adenylate cyclase/tetratricopeptide (TPR) repeat protein